MDAQARIDGIKAAIGELNEHFAGAANEGMILRLELDKDELTMAFVGGERCFREQWKLSLNGAYRKFPI